jgi:NodT family efflux transporter outer membrane factor (OMF) lipoprotein
VIRETEQQLKISRENVKLQQASYNITELLFRSGETSELDMQQAESLLLGTQATIPALEALLQQTRNSLDQLLGRAPGFSRDLLTQGNGIPTLPQDVAVGFPADMLRQRPDVREAEFLAMAQNAQVGMAEADLYPSFSLTGGIGLSAGGPGDSDFGDLFSSSALSYAIGANFVWPFLNYDRIRNNIRVEDARLQQALLNYQNVVISAAREAENAMAAYMGARQQAILLEQSVQAALRSNQLSTLQYREGFSDYQRVLDAQRNLFANQQRNVSAQASAARSLVTLNQALGAGWQDQGDVPQLDAETVETMRQRTNWGALLDDYPASTDEADSQ